MKSISVVINTKNAAATLADTLKSVSFADQVVVVDMHSTDQTVSMAKKAGAEVFTFKEDVGFVEPARNYALSKATGDWILIVDADEVVVPGLQTFIIGLLTEDAENGVVGDVYYLPRRNLIFGYEMKATGWWPDHQIRLFRAGHVQWDDAIHSVPITTGKVVELPADTNVALLHHNMPTVSSAVERINRYTSITAEQLGPQSKVSAAQVFDSYTQEQFRRLFAEEGWRDGTVGVAMSVLQPVYQMLVALKRWELAGTKNQATSYTDFIRALDTYQRDLSYWILSYRIAHSRGPIKWWWQLRRKFLRSV